MKIFGLFTFLLTTLSFACDVRLPARLVVLGEGGGFHQTVNSKNCSEATMNEIQGILSTIDGRISSQQLNTMLKTPVTISPQQIQVQTLKSLMQEQLNLPAGLQVKSTRAVNASGFLGLSTGDHLELSCGSCLYGAKEIINIQISGFDGTIKSVTASAAFKKMVRAYRTNTFLNSFTDVSSQNLKEEFVDAVPYTDLVTDLSILKFYKTNKPIKSNELLKFSDLNALNLVRAGLKTDVIIENQVIKIKTQGISRSNGSLGELVEVFHPQKNKRYQGKVIDVNKVLVEL